MKQKFKGFSFQREITFLQFSGSENVNNEFLLESNHFCSYIKKYYITRKVSRVHRHVNDELFLIIFQLAAHHCLNKLKFDPILYEKASIIGV